MVLMLCKLPFWSSFTDACGLTDIREQQQAHGYLGIDVRLQQSRGQARVVMRKTYSGVNHLYSEMLPQYNTFFKHPKQLFPAI
jgi:hypothetical protein